jgi:hypothetical protein
MFGHMCELSAYAKYDGKKRGEKGVKGKRGERKTPPQNGGVLVSPGFPLSRE